LKQSGFDLKKPMEFAQAGCALMAIKPHPDFDEINPARRMARKLRIQYSGAIYHVPLGL
jgi:hypothetical protein